MMEMLALHGVQVTEVNNLEIFINWFLEFNRFSALAGSLYFIFFIKKWKGEASTIFWILLLSLLADNLNYFFTRVYINSYIVSNGWYVANFVLTIVLFNMLLSKRKVLIIISIIFLIGSVVSFGMFYTFTEPNTFIRIYSNVSFVLLALTYFLELLRNPSSILSKHPYFWISTALFIYNSIVLLQSLFKNYLIFDLQISKEGYAWILFISLFANITKNFIFFYALVLIDKGYPDTLKTAKAT